MNAFGAQTVMEVRRIARNTRFLIFTLLTPLVYYIFFVLAFGDRTSAQGISGKAFFLVSMAAFGVIGTALVSFAGRIAAERQRGWFRLLRTTPLPTSAIFGATLVAVGTESFRDPAAGSRIVRELRENAANSANPFA